MEGVGFLVDPVSVTVGVAAAALVAKLFDKAMDKAADAAIDTTTTAAGKLVTWLREKFRGSPEAATALKELEAAPDSSRREVALAEVIDSLAGEDPTFRAELTRLVEQAQLQQGAQISYQSADHSSGAVQVANSDGATISINQPPRN